MELLSNLGINSKLVLAQIINFFVLLYILKKFVYKPILKILEERSDKIEKGLKDAEESSKKLKEIEEKEKKVLTIAKKEAQGIIASAEQSAKAVKKEIEDDAKNRVEKILQDANKKLEEERMKMISEVKTEMANLVVLATEKIINEKLSEEKDKKLVEKIIDELG
ncbi:MAG: ATP synthase subunit b [Candidatus Moranbacteria bacterium GW2011_GWE2_35_2-]|nr:MAG: ATP synthase subunit b [Candidatus Moranbacteria bacterium GW2011_GWE2_35_2-]KKQ04088.1 MAG: ATP synthase subunit b [Candidatus Moranbacteria bacterium GW2011_GWF1_36_4]KKQ22252.1 MAG: ATP synthase subunit b [Candidatus Moranbacteria bacterium GW2011_GWF2_37_11]KKQ28590.1 MAG: ATP synthase subunit b [Candidatus Moranbacteria bacterium GW2011_GWD1_37_17]KKQ30256.1 MAG: ATP synthase subunit b [Candidatus Moranbacteria bacterium GW2011_GWE1_37_24]KKQ47487.1 MAG: ATP synthase subunit b [Ca